MIPQVIQAFVGVEFVVLLVLAYLILCVAVVAGRAALRLLAGDRTAAAGAERAEGTA
jgi:Na+-transporting methylmalonyl-CoA/oxaloacetate decarboxylase gamma subunit